MTKPTTEEFIAAALNQILSQQVDHTKAIENGASEIRGMKVQMERMNGNVSDLMSWKHEVEKATAYAAGWAASNKRMFAITAAVITAVGAVGGVVVKVGLPVIT